MDRIVGVDSTAEQIGYVVNRVRLGYYWWFYGLVARQSVEGVETIVDSYTSD